MITGLRANNFKKLEDFSATFTEGTNLIVGENGQGKSTSFDAIRFALFGASGVTGSADTLTTWGKKGMWVELDINGFTIRRTKSDAKVYDADEQLVASGNTPATKFAVEMLSCGLKDFDLLFMSKQNETAGLITFGATELNRKVEEYAGVAKIDKIIKILGSEVNGIQIALKSFEYINTDELEASKVDISQTIEEKRALFSASKPDYELAADKVKEIGKQLEEAMSFNAKQDIAEQNRSKVDKQLASAKLLLDTATSELDSLRDKGMLESCAPSIAEYKQRIESATNIANALIDAKKNKEATERLIAQAKEKLAKQAEFEAGLPEIEAATDLARKNHDKTKDLVKEAERKKLAAKKVVDSGVCPACDRPFENYDEAEAKLSLDKANSDYESLLADENLAMQDLAEATRKLNAHRKLNQGEGWEDELTKLETKLAETEQKVVELGSEVAEPIEFLQDKLTELIGQERDFQNWTAQMETAVAKKSNAEKSLNSVQEKYNSLPEAAPKIEISKLTSDLANANTKKGDLARELQSIKSEADVLKEKLAQVETSLSAAKANNAKMAELETDMSVSSQLRKYLNDERVKFMEGVWRTILGTATHFINKSTNGWISAVGRNDRGDFTFTENGHEAVAKESASGAQKAFIGTAIKVGLAQAKMGSSSMVLLDEPTADMRDDRAGQLASGLMMLSGQKIMITHRDSERMVAQNIVYVGDN